MPRASSGRGALLADSFCACTDATTNSAHQSRRIAALLRSAIEQIGKSISRRIDCMNILDPSTQAVDEPKRCLGVFAGPLIFRFCNPRFCKAPHLDFLQAIVLSTFRANRFLCSLSAKMIWRTVSIEKIALEDLQIWHEFPNRNATVTRFH